MKDKTFQRRKLGSGFLGMSLKRLFRRPKAVIGIAIIMIMIMIAVIAMKITPFGYADMNIADRFQTPNAVHLLGTDQHGRDVLSRLMYGAHYSLTIGIVSVVLSLFMGIILGSLAGFFGGKIDMTIMRLLDIIQSIPSLLLAICISAVLGAGFWQVIVSIAITCMPEYVRMLRASMMTVRDQEFVEAAVSIDCSKFRIISKHVLPNSLSPLIVLTTMNIANAIITASSISFIGLGVQPPSPEWGAMLSDAKAYIRDYPYLVMIPGITIMITVLSINMVGDALRDVLDPKLRR